MKNRKFIVAILLTGALSLIGGAPANSKTLEQIAAGSNEHETEQQTEYLGLADGILPNYGNKGVTRIHVRSRDGKTAGVVSLDPYKASVEIFRYTQEGKETITISPDSAKVLKQGHPILQESCIELSGQISHRECYVDPDPIISTFRGNYMSHIQRLGAMEQFVEKGAPIPVYVPIIK